MVDITSPGPHITATDWNRIYAAEERAYREMILQREAERQQMMMYPLVAYDPRTGVVRYPLPTPRPCCDICEATKGAHHSMSCTAPGVDPDSRVHLSELLSKVFRNGELEQVKKQAFEIAREADKAQSKEPLPIHRALSRMLYADERYENRVFLPGGTLVRGE